MTQNRRACTCTRFDLMFDNLQAFGGFVLFFTDSCCEFYRVGLIDAPRVAIKTNENNSRDRLSPAARVGFF